MPQTRTIRPRQSPCLDHSASADKPGPALLAHRRFGPVPHITTAPQRPAGLPHNANSQTVLAKDPAQDLPEFDQPRSAEILTSTSTGAHNNPLDPALDKPIDPGAPQPFRLLKHTSNRS